MKVALIAVGDPCSSTTWSCVPCNLVKEFRRRGHDVVPLDISSDFAWHWCGVFFNRILRRICKPLAHVSFCNTKFALALSRIWLKRRLSRIEGGGMV